MNKCIGGHGKSGGYGRVIINLPNDFAFFDAEKVKEENTKLKELNQELVGVLAAIIESNTSYVIPDDFRIRAEKALKKARS